MSLADIVFQMKLFEFDKIYTSSDTRIEGYVLLFKNYFENQKYS